MRMRCGCRSPPAPPRWVMFLPFYWVRVQRGIRYWRRGAGGSPKDNFQTPLGPPPPGVCHKRHNHVCQTDT